MFNDERITYERGKIFRKANILVIILSVFFIICRVCIYHFEKYSLSIGLLATEICTILFASTIILYGEIAFKGKISDERTTMDKYNYYSRMGKYLLVGILLGYSISMIFVDDRSSMDFSTNNIILIFQFVGGIFIYYEFKKKSININYSFIHKSKKEYYKDVFKLIGYLALIISLMYIVCGTISAIKTKSLLSFLNFLLAGLFSIIGLGIEYLLLSFFEKMDYDDENEPIKKGFILNAILILILMLVINILTSTYQYIVSDDIVEKGDLISTLTRTIDAVTLLNNIYLGISFTYLISYYPKEKHLNRSVAILLGSLIIINVLYDSIFYTVLKILFFVTPFEELASFIIKITVDINTTLCFIEIIIMSYVIYSLIKECKKTKLLIMIPAISVISQALRIFSSTQGEKMIAVGSIIANSMDFISWLILYLALIIQNKKTKEVELKLNDIGR